MRGPNNVRGYWNKPKETAEAFTDGWFHTGDAARIDEDGFVYVVDRIKDMVLRGGENVYCAEVEAAIFEHPAVADVAVFGIPDDRLGEEVATVVNLQPGRHARPTRELQEFLGDQARSVQGAVGDLHPRRRAAPQRHRQGADVTGVADAQVLGGARPLVKMVLDAHMLELYGIRVDEVFRAPSIGMDEFEGAGVVQRAGNRTPGRGTKAGQHCRRCAKAWWRDAAGRASRSACWVTCARTSRTPYYFVRANGQERGAGQCRQAQRLERGGRRREFRSPCRAIKANVPSKIGFHVENDQGKELEDKLDDLLKRSFIILGILFVMLARTSCAQADRHRDGIDRLLHADRAPALLLHENIGELHHHQRPRGVVRHVGGQQHPGARSIHRRLEALERAQHLGFRAAPNSRWRTTPFSTGTKDIVNPALASTLTHVVVFGSFVFLSGRLALYYVPLAVSVTRGHVRVVVRRVRLGADGAAPRVGTAAGNKARRRPGGRGRSRRSWTVSWTNRRRPRCRSRAADRFYKRLQRGWWLVLPLSAAIFAGGWWVYDHKVVKGGFWRFPKKEELFLYLEMPSGTDLEVTSETLRIRGATFPRPRVCA